MLCTIFILAIEILNTELQKQVLANHRDLLSQATWVEKLEGVLSIMQSHVQVHKTFVNINNKELLMFIIIKQIFRVF